MKRTILAVAAVVALTASPATAAESVRVTSHGEAHARHRDHVPDVITYTGNYEQIDKHVRCFEGRAHHHTRIGKHAVHKGHLIQYCSDGWINIQLKGAHYHAWYVPQTQGVGMHG